MWKKVFVSIVVIMLLIGLVQVISYEDTSVPEPGVQNTYGEYLAYEVVGDGDENLILIHGSPGDRSTFESFAPLLAKEYTIYIFEMPGFGESEMHVSNYGYEASAGRLYQALDSLGLETYIIAGYSWGGGVAIHYAANYPGKIQELWLIGGVGVPKGFHTGTWFTEQLRMQTVAPFLLVYPGSVAPRAFDFKHRYGFWRGFVDGDTRIAYMTLPRIEVPTRIIHGDTDTVVGVSSAYMHHELIPDSTLEFYEGNHGAIFQDPQVIVDVIRGENE